MASIDTNEPHLNDAELPQVAPTSQDITELITSVENETAPTDEYRFHHPFRRLSRAFHESKLELPADLVAEVVAFELHAHDHQSPSNWGIYFGPMMSGFTAAGDAWDSAAHTRE